MFETTVQSSSEGVQAPVEQFRNFIKTITTNDKVSGQVQVRFDEVRFARGNEKEESFHYLDSSIYDLLIIDDVITFKAANAEGKLVRYKSVDIAKGEFIDEEGKMHIVVFPGFKLVEPPQVNKSQQEE